MFLCSSEVWFFKSLESQKKVKVKSRVCKTATPIGCENTFFIVVAVGAMPHLYGCMNS